MSKKRNYTEVEAGNDYPSKAKRALKDRDAVKVKLTNPILLRLKQTEKNRTLAIRTGMHPTLKKAKDQITKLSINLKKVEEQSSFWRRKTMDLQKELLTSKKHTTHYSEQVAKLERERVMLQNKVTAAEEQSSTITNAMRSLIAENNELKETITHMDAELNALMKCDADNANAGAEVTEDAKACIELEKALEETMADLSERLAEIEDLKELLAKVTIEKNLLEKQVTKKQIIAEIVNINHSEHEDNTVNGKIAKLEEAVEKCMFRIAVLSQKNEELMKMSGDVSFCSDRDARMMDVLEDDDKVCLLESVCMRRYRTLLKDAAQKLVCEEAMNDSFLN